MATKRKVSAKNDAVSSDSIKKAKKEPIIIALYAEKGGVGKTTLTITLGQMLAERNKRVLIYDCDSQRSLTAWIFNKEIEERYDGDVTAFVNAIDSKKQRTFYEQFNSSELQPAHVRNVRDKQLWVVPGHRDINKLDKNITLTEAMCEMDVLKENSLTGKPYHAILKTAEEYKIDVVLLDLNPNSSELNRCLIMSSQYLIIPTIPDFFSKDMLKNMSDTLLGWYRTIEKVSPHTKCSKYPFPEINPKFLGYIVSRFIPRNKNNSRIENGVAQDTHRKFEQKWIDLLKQHANELTSLSTDSTRPSAPLAISQKTYKQVKRSNLLGRVREFHTLKNISDMFNVPVPLLGKVPIKINNKNVKEFKEIFNEIINTILKIIEKDRSK